MRAWREEDRWSGIDGPFCTSHLRALVQLCFLLAQLQPHLFPGWAREAFEVQGGRLKPLPPKDTGLLLLPQPGHHVHTGAPSPAQCLESWEQEIRSDSGHYLFYTWQPSLEKCEQLRGLTLTLGHSQTTRYLLLENLLAYLYHISKLQSPYPVTPH